MMKPVLQAIPILVVGILLLAAALAFTWIGVEGRVCAAHHAAESEDKSAGRLWRDLLAYACPKPARAAQPTCEWFSCPSGHTLRPQAASIPGESTDECCVATCETVSCPVGHARVAAPWAIRESTAAACCDATCATVACRSGTRLRPRAEDIRRTTQEACCEPCAVTDAAGECIVAGTPCAPTNAAEFGDCAGTLNAACTAACADSTHTHWVATKDAAGNVQCASAQDANLVTGMHSATACGGRHTFLAASDTPASCAPREHAYDADLRCVAAFETSLATATAQLCAGVHRVHFPRSDAFCDDGPVGAPCECPDASSSVCIVQPDGTCAPSSAVVGDSCVPRNAATIGKCAGFLNALCTELHATTEEPQWIADSPPADRNHLTFVCKSATNPANVAMHDSVDSQWESSWYDKTLQTVGADDLQLACEQAISHKYDATLQCTPEQSLKKMIAGICAHQGMISTYGDFPVTTIFDPTLATNSDHLNMCEPAPVAGASCDCPHDDDVGQCVALQDGTGSWTCAPPPWSCTVDPSFSCSGLDETACGQTQKCSWFGSCSDVPCATTNRQHICELRSGCVWRNGGCASKCTELDATACTAEVGCKAG